MTSADSLLFGSGSGVSLTTFERSAMSTPSSAVTWTSMVARPSMVEVAACSVPSGQLQVLFHTMHGPPWDGTGMPTISKSPSLARASMTMTSRASDGP